MAINKLKLGEVTPSKLYLGENEVLKAYMGETLVYEKPSSSGETWVLNETLTDYDSMNYGTESDWYGDSNGFSENINFICNGVQYYGINAFNTHTPPEITMSVKLVYNNSSWIDEKYRTVTFAKPPTGDLLTWLQSNGVKQ